ncbi:TerB family tellurite resistance protein [Aurantimonas sp. VKM B-3413]|uniref:tellurite resistance TerB family protein n=1 Tax=Aurantimonas sp. VKM B-3413 TaxID=2779401 RepID=UPI001E3F429A|nr:TerB family tellurite resistance protein [Aurantimonas sp. VKM B-3413]MCB8837739.1 TerB family tellurite resistance protein [Aurantimonas sp. VKM B-3413]
MFESFREFIRTLASDEDERRSDPADDVRVAAAALLFHIVDADGVVTDAERHRLKQVLGEEFGLAPGEADRIAEAGRQADQESVDLYNFTSVLKSRLSEEKRVRFVELLWEVTYADSEVHELEDNLIWRMSELMGVSTRDRMLMKREAAEKSGAAD